MGTLPPDGWWNTESSGKCFCPEEESESHWTHPEYHSGACAVSTDTGTECITFNTSKHQKQIIGCWTMKLEFVTNVC